MSITKTAAALFIGSAVMFGLTAANAQSSNQQAYEEALDQCANLMKGQRSFCMIEAQEQYATTSQAPKLTPAQAQAKQAYNAAAEACADKDKGQRSFCMISAREAYKKAMGM